MRLHALYLASIVLFVPAGARQDDAVKDDLAKLQGEWVIVSYEKDGAKADDEDLTTYPVLTIKGKEFTWSNGALPGELTIRPSEKPKAADYAVTDGDTKRVEKAIYEINGDTWRDCMASSGKARPTEFAAPVGSGHTLIVYRRAR